MLWSVVCLNYVWTSWKWGTEVLIRTQSLYLLASIECLYTCTRHSLDIQLPSYLRFWGASTSPSRAEGANLASGQQSCKPDITQSSKSLAKEPSTRSRICTVNTRALSLFLCFWCSHRQVWPGMSECGVGLIWLVFPQLDGECAEFRRSVTVTTKCADVRNSRTHAQTDRMRPKWKDFLSLYDVPASRLSIMLDRVCCISDAMPFYCSYVRSLPKHEPNHLIHLVVANLVLFCLLHPKRNAFRFPRPQHYRPP